MSRRLEKVAALIQQQAAWVVSQDFMTANVAITATKVDVSPDLKNATIFVSLVGASTDELRNKIAKVAPGLIAERLSQKTVLRSVPHLHIRFDESGEYAQHISELINTLKED